MQPPLEKGRPTHAGARKMPACRQLHHGPQRARNLPLTSNSRTAHASMPVPGGGVIMMDEIMLALSLSRATSSS